jgi:hypothetical protein
MNHHSDDRAFPLYRTEGVLPVSNNIENSEFRNFKNQSLGEGNAVDRSNVPSAQHRQWRPHKHLTEGVISVSEIIAVTQTTSSNPRRMDSSLVGDHPHILFQLFTRL